MNAKRGKKTFVKGQAALEYALIIGVIAAAFIAMQVYVERSMRGGLKTIQNQLNAAATE